jgi:hypothetical protein
MLRTSSKHVKNASRPAQEFQTLVCANVTQPFETKKPKPAQPTKSHARPSEFGVTTDKGGAKVFSETWAFKDLGY